MSTAALVAASLVVAQPASAAPPSNDNFANATVITGVSGSAAGTTVESTGETGEPVLFTYTPIRSIWYSWVAPTTGSETFNTCSTTPAFDTTLGVFTGSAVNALTTVTSDDDASPACAGSGVLSRVTFNAVSGTTYKIKIDSFQGATGPTVLTWASAVAAPANDNFASAVTLSGASGTVSGTNVNATGQTGEPINGDGPIRSVWYKYTPSVAGTFTVGLCASTSFDSAIGIYTGTAVNALATVATNDDGCGTFAGPSRIQNQVVSAGTTYYVSVDGFDGQTSSFALAFSFTAGVVTPPVNDNFANATGISGATGTINGTTVGSTGETGEPAISNQTTIRSIWYSWTAPSAGPEVFDTCGSNFDTTLGVFTGASVSTLTLVTSNDQASPACASGANQSRVTFTATAGTTYRIKTDGFGGVTGTTVLNWAPGVPPPANDNFANAAALSGASASVNGNNANATSETGEPRVSTSSSQKTLWYNWTAPSSGSATFGLCTGTAFDTLLGVYTGSAVNALTVVASNDDTTGCGTGSQSRVTFNAVAGTSYKVQFDGYAGASGAFTLTYSLAAPLTLAISDVTQNEGNTSTTQFTFTVTLSAAAASTVTVNYATADQTATAPADYASTTGTITFTAGQTSKTIVVPVVGDLTFEPTETFVVNLTAPVGATIADNQGVGTITNDDNQPSIAIGDVTQAEGDSGTTPFSFPVTLSNPSSSTITVNYATTDGTATSPSDYAVESAPVTFNPGQTTKTVTIAVVGDTTFEDNETFSVGLAAAVGASIADDTAVGTISNDDAAPTLSIGDVSQLEGDAGTSVYTFPVTLSAVSEVPVTADYATAEGTATAPSDFVAVTGTLTFNAGQTTTNVTVVVKGDAVFEPDETFTVDLSNASGAGITDSQGLGTIVNDDAAPSLSIGNATATEGDSGTTAMDFTVTLSGPSALTATVQYATADDSATSPADYSATSGTLTFAPGDTTATISVQVNGDDIDELDETFTVALSASVNASIDDGTATGTIVDDDATPAISIGDVSSVEGDSGTTAFEFPVALSRPSSRSVTVDYATSNGTATAPSDYTGSTGTITFAAGDTTGVVSVAVNGDIASEPDETFTVTLTDPVRATLSDAAAVGTILNDDGQSTFAIDDIALDEGDSGTKAFSFTVTRSGNSATAASVGFATSDGTATAPGDYTADTGTVNFNAGQSTKQVVVQVLGDNVYESDEFFDIDLSNPVGATIADGHGVGLIINDDAVPSISIANVIEDEGNSATSPFTVTVLLSNPSDQSVTVDYATLDGTAISPADFTAETGVFTFAPGETVKTVNIAVNGDATYENNEAFTVELSNATNASVADGSAIVTIRNDDGAPSFSVNDVTHPEGDSGTTSYALTVTLTGDTALTSTVGYATNGGTATSPEDYADLTGALTFAPGETTKTVTVAVNGDVVFEPDEAFGLVLSGAANASISDNTGVGSIQNDDAQPEVSVGNESQQEGNSGTRTFVFDVTLSGPSSVPTAVQWATSDNTATAPSDYNTASGTVAFAPGEVAKTITVTVNGDVVFEASETFTVTLSTPSNATIDDGTGVGTIVNDDTQPAVSIAAVSDSEGNSGTHPVTLTLSLTNPSSQTVTVNYATTDGSATAGQDYQSTSGVVTFPPGQVSRTITVIVTGDTTFEENETFGVVLSAPTNASLADNSAVVTITNDDPSPILSVTGVTKNEGNSGATTFPFVVTLSNPTYQTVTVTYSTNDATASSASDFTGLSGTLTFAPGQLSQTVTVLVNGDTLVEPNETFGFDLNTATNAGIAVGHADGVITNDDVATADLGVTITDNPDPVQVGNLLTYTVTVTNSGSAQATGVTLTDSLPSGPTFVSAMSSQGTCSGTTTVTCTIGTVAAGASVTATIVIRPTRTGSYTNTASVSSTPADSNPANNQATATTTAVANAANCTIVGTAGNDEIIGTAGIDVICAGDGNDRIDGAGGNDTIRGEAGNDLMGGGAGNDAYDGGTGTNTIAYDASPAGVTASLAAGTGADGYGTNDVLTNVSVVRGTRFADTLTGSLGVDKLFGLGGTDTLKGNNGNDLLDGGAGTDSGNGGQGTDSCPAVENRTSCESTAAAAPAEASVLRLYDLFRQAPGSVG